MCQSLCKLAQPLWKKQPAGNPGKISLEPGRNLSRLLNFFNEAVLHEALQNAGKKKKKGLVL